MRERIDLQLMQAEHDYMNAKKASEELTQISKSSQRWIDMLKDKRLYEEQIEKSFLDALVDKVHVYDRNHIHIVLKFKNPFEVLNEFVEKVEKEVLRDDG